MLITSVNDYPFTFLPHSIMAASEQSQRVIVIHLEILNNSCAHRQCRVASLHRLNMIVVGFS